MLQARKSAMLLLREGRPFSWLIHIIVTLTILGVVLMMAIFVPDISNVFGVIGMCFFFFETLGKKKLFVSLNVIAFVNYLIILFFILCTQFCLTLTSEYNDPFSTTADIKAAKMSIIHNY